MNETLNLPIIDLHCDLLSYLVHVPKASPENAKEIGVAIPHLQKGNVALQVLAIYNPVTKGSAISGLKQSESFIKLNDYSTFKILEEGKLQSTELPNSATKIMASIENAAGFCEEDMPLDKGFQNLETIIKNVGQLFYIGITHHTENRFGGGNQSQVGLKEDGKVLLEYLDGKKIPVDLAHTSDALAFGIINHIEAKNLDVPIIASHSNFRHLYQHPRNLPNELVQEVIERNGIMGINFLRHYLHQEKEDALYDHLIYGIENLPNQICFGADFFYFLDFPDESRFPFYFPPFEDASKYPSILQSLMEKGITKEQLEKLAYKNALRFMQSLWS